MDLPLGRSPDMPAPVVESQDLGPLPVSYYVNSITSFSAASSYRECWQDGRQ